MLKIQFFLSGYQIWISGLIPNQGNTIDPLPNFSSIGRPENKSMTNFFIIWKRGLTWSGEDWRDFILFKRGESVSYGYGSQIWPPCLRITTSVNDNPRFQVVKITSKFYFQKALLDENQER